MLDGCGGASACAASRRILTLLPCPCAPLQRYWDLLVLISRPDLSARLLQENMLGAGGDAAAWAPAAVQAMHLSPEQRAALAAAWRQHRQAVEQRAARRQELLSAIRSGFLVVSLVPSTCPCPPSTPSCLLSAPPLLAPCRALAERLAGPGTLPHPTCSTCQRAGVQLASPLLAYPGARCLIHPCVPAAPLPRPHAPMLLLPSLPQHLQRASPEDIELGKPLARQGLGAMEALRLVVRQEHVSAVQLACGLRKVGLGMPEEPTRTQDTNLRCRSFGLDEYCAGARAVQLAPPLPIGRRGCAPQLF